MKNNKQKSKLSIKDIVNEAFMNAPIPMSITNAKDGTYIEINETAVKFMGLKREEIIGKKSSVLGHFPEEKRHMFLDQIKKQGFATNIPLELKIKNEGILKMFFGVYPIKIGKDEFYLSFAHYVSNNKPVMKKFNDDKFHKMTFLDYKHIKSILAQYNLTPRQREISLLSAMGSSNRDIAKKLCISEHTVKDHLKEIYKTLDIPHRSKLIPKLLNLI